MEKSENYRAADFEWSLMVIPHTPFVAVKEDVAIQSESSSELNTGGIWVDLLLLLTWVYANLDFSAFQEPDASTVSKAASRGTA